ncbi:restriction endonuclease subunit S [Salmonella enterica subsp. diarizonae]|uniref:Restriction endonuclease subunit S n=1 Tax=Salmonella diarizonae TaxID=59204 RepID=A0A702D3Z3_SALDZ|nr:restriction endonuclease subunit S [Salmonella enterica subsp. arizonae]EBP3804975.1 restriction endonuclease subunit S [Salmonella enterica subsp. enterica]ECE6695274.1 restriction endonuclease subunit S [Salmonella enterica subsp. diarizonae]ECT9943567.1 restriction endonuclease subunit S [Salmonella enterica]EHN1751376.1 restriction endonuclease subunit S [Salmonella enterica subsp. diarizonae serovar 50:z52:z35]EKR1794782.1 restriction endonuclease subunit S [Salmonella enterica subsp. 
MAVEKLIVDHIDTWTTALQTRSTAGRGSSGKIDLYGIKKLRELILELAVRGKLVPQDPNDEPASELLKRIAAEKAELVKQGKIKKQKPLPEISEEEKPFELPVGWEWARFETALDFSGGSQPPKSFFIEEPKEGYVQLIQIRDLGEYPQPVYVPINKVTKLCTSEDILIGRYGASVGKVFWGKNGAYNVALIKIDNSYNLYNNKFLFWLLKSPLGQSLFSGISRSAQDGFNKSDIAAKLLPVLSEKEQSKIVVRINDLMSLCDQLEQHSLTSLDVHQQLVETLLTTLTDSQNADELAENWARISEHFDTLFTTEASIDALKQTILQLAVMGKLVPQDPNDEPASELLKRIAQEKAQLMKDGKIKKQKPLPPISDEEKPFELPEGWEWCIFEDVVDIQSGITKGRNLANRKLITVPYLRVANVQRGYLDLSEVKEIDIPAEEKDKYHVIKGDLLITEGGDWDTVGRTTVWCHDWYIANQNHVFKGRIIGQDIDPYWLETYMNSPYSRDYFASASKQTTNLASINKTQLRGCPVAIPSSSEAEKIMLKLNNFNKLCEKLKLQIQSAQQTQLHLADALTDAAIN